MRKLMMIAVALVAGAAGLNQVMAQQSQQQAAADDMKMTGMVAKADEQTREITIGDKKFVMPATSGGASVFPQVGAEVTVFYEQQDGKNVITRIGQAQ